MSTLTTSASPSPIASIRARVRSARVRRLTRSTSVASRSRKWSRASGSSLAPERRTSIAPGHAGDRVAELVGGVGDELALGLVAAELLGAVADDEQGGALGRQVAGADREDPLADRDVVALGAAAVGGAADPGPQGVDDGPVLADQAGGRGVGEADVAVGIDDDHRLVERGEDRRQPVALGGERVERLGEGDPHRIERPPEIADLVSAARIHGRVEVALGELTGRRGEPLDPGGDQARDQEADQAGDQDRDDRAPSAAGRRSAWRAERTSSGRSEIDSSTPCTPWLETSWTATIVRSFGLVGADVEVAVERGRHGLGPAPDRGDVRPATVAGLTSFGGVPGRRVVVEPGAEVLARAGLPEDVDGSVGLRHPGRCGSWASTFSRTRSVRPTARSEVRLSAALSLEPETTM